jgi:replicative DNA helicase
MSGAKTPAFTTAADALGGWLNDLLTGKAPVLWRAGVGDLEAVEIGPGLLNLLGGAPGGGKTALATQLAIDALRMNPGLRCVIANVVMGVGALLDRMLARLAGLDAALIRHRRIGAEHAARLDRGLAVLDSIADRLAFLKAPFDLANLAAAADDFGASLLLIDYVQRLTGPERGGDRRGAVDAVMGHPRRFADVGVGVLAVSAVGRQKDANGTSSYGGLNLASFKESGELDYGCDSAYLLVPDPERGDDAVMLLNPKNCHGEPRDIPLKFHRSLQCFEAVGTPATTGPDGAKLRTALADLWTQSTAADDEGED